MKRCYAEVMKMIKDLKSKKDELLNYQVQNKDTSYLGQEKPLPSSYSYRETQDKLVSLDDEIRRLKELLAKKNVSTIIEGYNITLSEGLILLAQLNSRLLILSNMIGKNKISRVSKRMTNVSEYTVLNYDPEEVQKDYDEIKESIFRLQLAIDRTNLTNYIDL